MTVQKLVSHFKILPYFFFLVDGRWARALPAADFEDLLVRLSFRTEDAARAAFLDVTLRGAFVCDSALPAALFDLAPVDLFWRVDEAFFAALGLVTLGFAILMVLSVLIPFGFCACLGYKRQSRCFEDLVIY